MEGVLRYIWLRKGLQGISPPEGLFFFHVEKGENFLLKIN